MKICYLMYKQTHQKYWVYKGFLYSTFLYNLICNNNKNCLREQKKEYILNSWLDIKKISVIANVLNKFKIETTRTAILYIIFVSLHLFRLINH